MLRGVLGVVCGGAAWYVLFFVFAVPLAYLWPAYAAKVQTYLEMDVFDFTTGMYWSMVAFWIMAEIGGGCVAALVAKRREGVWALAVVLMAYMGFMHLYYEWDRLPWWYNVLVALPVAPAVLLGGALAGRLPQRGVVARAA